MDAARRQFLATSLAGGALLACAAGFGRPRAFAQGPREPLRKGQAPLGVALLGLGHYSEHLLAKALQRTQHCKLRGIVTGSPHKIPIWQSKFAIPDRNVYSYETLPRIADNPDIDIVYVVTPPSLHAKYSVMAANAGKHVWCEKPMAMTVAECQQIIDACNKNKVKLSM